MSSRVKRQPFFKKIPRRFFSLVYMDNYQLLLQILPCDPEIAMDEQLPLLMTLEFSTPTHLTAAV